MLNIQLSSDKKRPVRHQYAFRMSIGQMLPSLHSAKLLSKPLEPLSLDSARRWQNIFGHRLPRRPKGVLLRVGGSSNSRKSPVPASKANCSKLIARGGDASINTLVAAPPRYEGSSARVLLDLTTLSF